MWVLALGKKEAGGVQAHGAMLPNSSASSQGGCPRGLWLAGFGLFVYLVVLLLRESGQLWALPVGSIQVSPWEARRPGGDGLTNRE
jgi:hypothetical protein